MRVSVHKPPPGGIELQAIHVRASFSTFKEKIHSFSLFTLSRTVLCLQQQDDGERSLRLRPALGQDPTGVALHGREACEFSNVEVSKRQSKLCGN